MNQACGKDDHAQPLLPVADRDLVESVQVTLLFEAYGYQSRTESGPLDPSEDIKMDIMTEPLAQ